MASMQMCRPACESSYSETEKVKCSSGSHSQQGYYSNQYKHHETEKFKCASGGSQQHQSYYSNEYKHHDHSSSGGYTMAHGAPHVGSAMMQHNNKHPTHTTNVCSQDTYKPALGCGANQGGAHVGATHTNNVCSQGSYKPALACGTNQSGGTHMGAGAVGMAHKNPGNCNSTGNHHHQSLSDKITGYFGHHGSSHQSSYSCSEKKEEHKSCKSGHVKSKVHIKQKSSWKGKCKDGSDSSDSESDNEGCKKRC